MDLGGELDINDNCANPPIRKLELRPIGRVAGAEILDLDLSLPLSK